MSIVVVRQSAKVRAASNAFLHMIDRGHHKGTCTHFQKRLAYPVSRRLVRVPHPIPRSALAWLVRSDRRSGRFMCAGEVKGHMGEAVNRVQSITGDAFNRVNDIAGEAVNRVHSITGEAACTSVS